MYLRNFPYEAIETPNSKPLTKEGIKRIERMIRKYGGVNMDFVAWTKGKRMVERKAA